MKKKIFTNKCIFLLLLFIFLLPSCLSHKKSYSPNEFNNLLEKANLVFLVPKDFKPVPVIENKQCRYDMAYLTSNGVEVRYLINYNPNISFSSYFMMVVGNIISQENIPFTDLLDSTMSKIYTIKKDIIKTKVNADEGLACLLIDLNHEFGQDYKKCFVYGFSKNVYGFVITFKLYKDTVLAQNEFGFTNEAINMQFYKAVPPQLPHPKGINRILK